MAEAKVAQEQAERQRLAEEYRIEMEKRAEA